MKTINGKEIKGYAYADGVHWHWGNDEIAIIDETTNEIEWCVRKYLLPSEVIEEIRNKRNKPFGKWVIEVKRNNISATQGWVSVYVNGDEIISFGDDYKDGHFESETTNPGNYVCAALWHDYDNVYHYSDLFKKVFKGK